MSGEPLPTQLVGRSLVGTEERETPADANARTFSAVDPTTGAALEPTYRVATDQDVVDAGILAAEASDTYASLPGAERARFLRGIAEELDRARGAIVARGVRETALPEGRLNGELDRTTNQIRMFARLVEDDEWRDRRAHVGDDGSAFTTDLRSMRRAIGPVAVFGAGNFPLAFSVAGGDTASALAAGCPVIAKAHPGHPGLSELAGRAIARAAREAGMPNGVFSLLFDEAHEVGAKMVRLPQVRAVGFTGSRSGGEALMHIAAERTVPIPVFAEMGSINPLFLLPGAAEARAEEIAEGLHASVTLGVGQFCTKPGLVLVPGGAAGDAFVQALATRTQATAEATMLSSRTREGYERGLQTLRDAGATHLASGTPGSTHACGVAALWEVALEQVADEPSLLQEVFGPSALLVRYDDPKDLPAFALALEGQLTATLHAEPDELPAHRELIEALADRAGRVILNQYPTGVEVGPATVHGGPYPATSDGRSTSVGTRAIERFTRLVSYQNFPADVLPEVLRTAS